MFETIDHNKSGKIDYTGFFFLKKKTNFFFFFFNLFKEIEFLVAAMAKEKLLSKLKIEQAFALFDKDGDGFLEYHEINEIMGEVNEEKW